MEFTLGTHPLILDGMPPIETYPLPGNFRPGLRHRLRTGMSGAALTLESSADLLSWSPGAGEAYNSADESPSDDGTTARTFTPAAGAQSGLRYFRLRAARVP